MSAAIATASSQKWIQLSIFIEHLHFSLRETAEKWLQIKIIVFA